MPATNLSSAAGQSSARSRRDWPLERILFLMAGTMTALSAILTALVSPWFLLLTGFVALNQLLFVSVGHCGASLILEHVFGAKRAVQR
jgi:fatty acid desaturase